MFARASDAAAAMVAPATPAAVRRPRRQRHPLRLRLRFATRRRSSPMPMPRRWYASIRAHASDGGARAVAPPAPVAAPVPTAAAAMAAMAQTAVAQPQTTVPPPVPAEPAAPRFTGHPVTFDFQGADLRAVLRTFAEISGLNIVIDPTVQGTVDVSLKDVPWDQALDIILKANKLGYTVDGTIVRIAPLVGAGR